MTTPNWVSFPLNQKCLESLILPIFIQGNLVPERPMAKPKAYRLIGTENKKTTYAHMSTLKWL